MKRRQRWALNRIRSGGRVAKAAVITLCLARHEHGYMCTLARGHTGDHQAHEPGNRILATWSTTL